MDDPQRGAEPDWVAITRRNARSVQTTIGWIFWDPGAVARYEALGLSGPLGYIAARARPSPEPGPEAMAASFGSISPLGIVIVFTQLGSPDEFRPFWEARNLAVLEGLAEHAPAILEPLADFGPDLWRVAEQLPVVGRPFAASHLGVRPPDDPVLSGWQAVNYLREWRGDTHWALVATQGLSGDEASILHNAWLGYEGDWLSRSRGNTRRVDRGRLARAGGQGSGRGSHREPGRPGPAPVDRGRDRPPHHSTLGAAGCRPASVEFAERFEPPCELLLARVDLTAGPNYQPASRIRRRADRAAGRPPRRLETRPLGTARLTPSSPGGRCGRWAKKARMSWSAWIWRVVSPPPSSVAAPGQVWPPPSMR